MQWSCRTGQSKDLCLLSAEFCFVFKIYLFFNNKYLFNIYWFERVSKCVSWREREQERKCEADSTLSRHGAPSHSGELMTCWKSSNQRSPRHPCTEQFYVLVYCKKEGDCENTPRCPGIDIFEESNPFVLSLSLPDTCVPGSSDPGYVHFLRNTSPLHLLNFLFWGNYRFTCICKKWYREFPGTLVHSPTPGVKSCITIVTSSTRILTWIPSTELTPISPVQPVLVCMCLSTPLPPRSRHRTVPHQDPLCCCSSFPGPLSSPRPAPDITDLSTALWFRHFKNAV